MTTYKITLRGCHDATEFTLSLGDTEATTLMRIAHASQRASDYKCRPVILLAVHEAEGEA